MGTPNRFHPHILLAELKSRQEKGQGIDDLLMYILPIVENATHNSRIRTTGFPGV